MVIKKKMGLNCSKKEEIQQLESFRSYIDEKNEIVWGGGRRREERERGRKRREDEGRKMREEESITDEEISPSKNCLFCTKFFEKPKQKKPKQKQEV